MDLKNQIRKCDAGFDEYIKKPFSLEELYVRIKILLRRTNSANFKNGILNFGPLKLLPRTIMAKWFKSHVELKPVEFEFLYCLLQRHDRPVQIELIQKQVWGKVFENDINSIRGRIAGMEQRGNAQVVNAEVPLATMFGYVNTLRSLTQGRAQYVMQFDHYEPVPTNIADEIAANAN